MKRLIINADDFGYNRAVNRGIAAAFRAGGLKSTTLMATGGAFEQAVEISRELPDLGIGCHLALVGQTPVTPPERISTLIGADGRLWADLSGFARRWLTGKIQGEDVRREADAQVEKIIRAGIRPTHVDTHKHVMVLPGIATLIAEVCHRFGIPAVRCPFDGDKLDMGRVRAGSRAVLMRQWFLARAVRIFKPAWRRRMLAAGLRTPDRFRGVAFTGIWSAAYLERVVTTLAPGVTELMTHPGEMDDELQASPTRLKASRGQELDLLMRIIPSLLKRSGVKLVDYRALVAGGGKPEPIESAPIVPGDSKGECHDT